MKAILLFVVVAALASLGASFRCYQCQYHEDKDHLNTGCNNDGAEVPEDWLLPCPAYDGSDEHGYQCIKMIGILTDKDDNEFKYVQRGCSFGNNTFQNDCQESSALTTDYGTLSKGNLCHCDGEGCNSGNTFQQNIVMVSLVTFGAAVCRQAFL